MAGYCQIQRGLAPRVLPSCPPMKKIIYVRKLINMVYGIDSMESVLELGRRISFTIFFIFYFTIVILKKSSFLKLFVIYLTSSLFIEKSKPKF